jgi:hypothetical protein
MTVALPELHQRLVWLKARQSVANLIPAQWGPVLAWTPRPPCQLRSGASTLQRPSASTARGLGSSGGQAC